MRSKGAQRKNALTDNTNFRRAKYTVKQVVITNFATLRIKIPSGSLVNPTGSRCDSKRVTSTLEKSQRFKRKKREV